MIARLRLDPCLVLCATLAAAAAGCGRALDSSWVPGNGLAAGGGAAPTAPIAWAAPPEAGAEGAGGAFYPLELGNRWHYAREFRVTLRPFGGGDPPPPIVLRSTIERTLSCVEELSGRAYVVERSVETTGSGTTYYSWVRFRQGRSGLYEADVYDPPKCEGLEAGEEAVRLSRDEAPGDAVMRALSAQIADPVTRLAVLTAWERLRARLDAARGALACGGTIAPARRGGGPGAGEITRLRYPRHAGGGWVIRDAPRFDARVEGVDARRLPVGHVPGYRIRIESELFGPQDRARVWFGRSGQLMLAFYGESLATDPDGNPIGLLIAEESQRLDGIDLAGPGRF